MLNTLPSRIFQACPSRLRAALAARAGGVSLAELSGPAVSEEEEEEENSGLEQKGRGRREARWWSRPAMAEDGRYEGHGRMLRLEYTASRMKQGSAEQQQTLRRAIEETKRSTLDVSRYRSLVSSLHASGDASAETDEEWVARAEEEYKDGIKRSEAELEQHRSAAIKESIRLSFESRALLHWRRGELDEAMKCFQKTRDYCINSHNIVSMCMNVITLSILMRHFEHVHTHAQKAEQHLGHLGASPGSSLDCQLKLCCGIAYLSSKPPRFRKAADLLVQCNTNVTDGIFSMKQIASADDVASYGLLCALATFLRSELKAQVTEKDSFRQLLESRPSLKTIADSFVNGSFAHALSLLQQECNRLYYDVFIGDHVHSLLTSAWQRAILLYAYPFSHVHLQSIADAVNASVEQVEPELGTLISNGSLNARIDAYNGILTSLRSDKRSAAISEALQTSKAYNEEIPSMLMRASLLQHSLIVKKKSSGKSKSGSSGGHGGNACLGVDDESENED